MTPSPDDMLPEPGTVPDVVQTAAGYRRPAAMEDAIAGDARTYPPRPVGEQPREEEYSARTRVERYRPLRAAADALIDHLVTAFLCEVRDAVGEPVGFDWPGVPTGNGVLRDVVISSGLPDRADLRFRVTDYPSVIIGAGLFTQWSAPSCGCDACDESLGDAVDELERTVFAVVGGGFTERLSTDGTEQTTRLVTVDRGESGTSSNHQPPAVLARLAAVTDGWEPWPRRSASPTRAG